MSVRNCAFPWHWLIVTADGDVMPCSHGSRPVGNLRDSTIEEIWNGEAIQGVRRSILRNEVHPACACAGCPFQRGDPAYPENRSPLQIEEGLAESFDEEWYLERHSHIREAVANHAFSSGLEHFVRHGREEGIAFRRRPDPAPPGTAPPPNAVLALQEYARGRIVTAATPSDLILVVTNYCNLRCVMCPQGMREVRRPEHTPLGFAAGIRGFLRRAQRVILSGVGEPLLAPAFWDVVEGLKDKAFGLLRIHTNGHFLTEENTARLLQSGLNLLLVSLDAATEPTYRSIRGSDFARPLAGIRRLVAARKRHAGSRLRIGLTMTLMRDNIPEATKFIRLARDLEVDTAIFSQLFIFGDRPDWVIRRPGGDFVYSQQLLSRIPSEANHHLKSAVREAALLRVAVTMHDNVEAYIVS
jgi:radical SAM protein with 4Fe4S-binding SPASM domain